VAWVRAFLAQIPRPRLGIPLLRSRRRTSLFTKHALGGLGLLRHASHPAHRRPQTRTRQWHRLARQRRRQVARQPARRLAPHLPRRQARPRAGLAGQPAPDRILDRRRIAL